ncbi:hypothetical protein SXGG_00010 [Synechococcus phage S-CBP42]|uniref:Uncharacterized protein n=1 Tax=Synechococcus phage S-CBP42 TaxID=461711 RepID=G8EYD0_9CAUD|nr:hypothetical protein AVU76_gp19 [Synechococcus phage S-CBP42]AET72510.1 hypothetical protein SXGG_00010 [Synechococcus phage S-CBP42]AGK86671.1 hypothetical protein S-CBP42_0019 [Synechococcus phage S-CBP42]
MCNYPEQLQYYTRPSVASHSTDPKIRDTKVNGNEVVKAAGAVSGDINVNDLLHLIGQKLYGTALSSVRCAPRVRPFDTSFGNVVVYANAVDLAVDVTVNGAILELRKKWDEYRKVDTRRIGLATSVLK